MCFLLFQFIFPFNRFPITHFSPRFTRRQCGGLFWVKQFIKRMSPGERVARGHFYCKRVEHDIFYLENWSIWIDD
jgi:lipopolysaccharide/colanic/teichoic acid biosynthesis glycosyltransferase